MQSFSHDRVLFLTTGLIWMNRNIVSLKDAGIHPLTHSLHYGSSVFEGIKFYDTKKGSAVFRLKDHIERLFKAASVMGMEPPYTKSETISAIQKLIRAAKLKSGYIRPLLYYGVGAMQVIPKKPPVNMLIAVWPLDSYLDAKIVKVTISNYAKINPNATEVGVKLSGNYVNSILAGLEARKKGFHEALLLDTNGFIAEGSAENIFFVSGSEIITPKQGSILPGITRDSLIKIARDIDYDAKETDIKVGELKNFSESFFCGTATEIVPISQIDNIKYGKNAGSVTTKLKSEFMKIVNGENKKYEKWLTYID